MKHPGSSITHFFSFCEPLPPTIVWFSAVAPREISTTHRIVPDCIRASLGWDGELPRAFEYPTVGVPHQAASRLLAHPFWRLDDLEIGAVVPSLAPDVNAAGLID